MRCMDRRKLWGYLEELGVNGKFLKFNCSVSVPRQFVSGENRECG